MWSPSVSFSSLLAWSISLSTAQDADGSGQRCVVSSASGPNGTTDDTPAIHDALEACKDHGTVVFEKGKDYNVFSPVVAEELDHVTIEMHGNMHLPQDLDYVIGIYNESANMDTKDGGNLDWFVLTGPGLCWEGTSDISTGWIESYGQQWWDANPEGGNGIDGRPHLMTFTTEGGRMSHFKSRKPIAWGVRLEGRNITVTDAIVDTVSDSLGVNGTGFPFNTDGFQVAASDVYFSDALIYNGDDAIAIQDGAHNVRVEHSTIGYQSHGLSIGSLGKNQASVVNVSDIHFDDITVIDALYAARFKSWQGGQGLAQNLTWSNIRLYNVTFPIFVTQSYQDQNAASEGRKNNASVEMRDFKWENFTGTINNLRPGDGSCVTDPCWYETGLPNLSYTDAIILECNTNTSCQNFETSNLQMFPESMDMPTTICLNATAELNPMLGFKCDNGTLVE